MKTYSVSIKGTTPLLQHRFGEQTEGEGAKASRNILVNRGTPREEAEKVVYRNANREFYFPGAAISRLLREAGSNHKLKGSRKSAKFVIPAAVLVLDDGITICNGDAKPIKDFEVDSRPVTIPATKGRIMRHRPRFDQWSARFNIRINEQLLPVDFIQQLLTEGGQQIGIGDFRPEKGGPFGQRDGVGGEQGLTITWRGTAMRGTAWPGGAWRCEAWHGLAMPGAAMRGMDPIQK
jgi:hypothetical protein